MNRERNTLAVLLIASIVGLLLLKPYLSQYLESFTDWQESQTDGTVASAYFTPWWRSYFSGPNNWGGPYYGTRATALDQVKSWPYSSAYWRNPGTYYNYWSYWRRPHYYNYWRTPYYFRRPVYRPYARDSIQGRRQRLRRFSFPEVDEQCLDKTPCAKLQRKGSYLYGTSRDYY